MIICMLHQMHLFSLLGFSTHEKCVIGFSNGIEYNVKKLYVKKGGQWLVCQKKARLHWTCIAVRVGR